MLIKKIIFLGTIVNIGSSYLIEAVNFNQRNKTMAIVARLELSSVDGFENNQRKLYDFLKAYWDKDKYSDMTFEKFKSLKYDDNGNEITSP